MNQSQKLSISPLKGDQPFFPPILFKTSESPQKTSIPLDSSMLFKQKKDEVNDKQMENDKQLKYDRTSAIYKYLHQYILKKKDLSQQKPKVQNKTPITDFKNISLNSQNSSSSFQQLKKIMKKSSKQKILKTSHSYQNCIIQTNLSSDMQDQCILELEQEQDDCEQLFSHQVKNKLNYTHNVQNNFNGNNIQKKQKLILNYNQQNKEYKEKSIQIIQMIRNAQQNILQERDEDRKELEKEYKSKKNLRQKERQEGLYIAQMGLKNRKLKLFLNSLKGSEVKKIYDQQILNIKIKHSIQRSYSTIISRKSSFQQSNQDYLNDNKFDEKIQRKVSQTTDVCNSESSKDSFIQKQFPKKLQKAT